MTEPISPLAPKNGFPSLPEIPGVKFASVNAGGKYTDRDDVMLVHLVEETAIAGVFTTSRTCSAAVENCRAKIGGASKDAAAFLVNAGNANAFTGGLGRKSVEELSDLVATSLGIPPGRVFTASTGVIGEPLDHQRIGSHIGELKANLNPGAAAAAAKAILTTDTFPKGSTTELRINSETIHLAGFAKGSGMIAPDMATMLAYVFTNATINQSTLQAMVQQAAEETFNCISVDSDTSTSDTLLVAATGRNPASAIQNHSTPEGQAFYQALRHVMLDLAQQVVRDGEGASKFIEIKVSGATTPDDAKKVARSVADSPLVKTAIAGQDPNWGRIVMAVGKSGAMAERDLLSIWFGDILVAEKGWVSPNYSEQTGVDYMKNEEIQISIDLGLGRQSATVWTCDLTHGYITINADYRS